MKIGLICLGFPNFRYDYAKVNLENSLAKIDFKEDLDYVNEVLIDEKSISNELTRLSNNNVDMLIVQCGTYSFGSAMMEIISKFTDTPLVLWGFTEPRIEGFRGLPLNSLCAVNMYGSFLRKVERDFDYVYGSCDDKKIYQKLNKIVKAVKIKTDLKTTKFCIVGGRVPGFYLSNVDEIKLRHEIGVELVYYSIALLIRDMDNIDQKEVDDEVDKINKEVTYVKAERSFIEQTARMYLALIKYKELNNIDGYTIKCWPELQELKNMSGCHVIARLNDNGIMTSCEGDIPSLLTQYIQFKITNKPCFLADLVNLNENDSFKTWHCGPAPLTLARDNQTSITMHPTMLEVGTAMEFKLPINRVTVLKISECKDGYKMFIATGKSVLEDRDMKANQSDILFDAKAETVLSTIMDEGIEHHYAIVYQDIKKEILAINKMLNIRSIVVGENNAK
jgi:L-fucose isomerase-like protein